MALIDYKSKEEKKPQPVTPAIEPINFKSPLVDTEFVLRSNIITQIQGSPWKVEYYSQVLARDSELNGHNPSKDALNQSFIKIKDFVLRVTSPLSTAQDDVTNAFTVNGTANTYPFLKPNKGDMFVANIGDGRLGIFTVTNIEEKSIYKETTATIDYQLVSYADGNQGSLRYKDLESKVIETQHFVYEFMDYNQSPYVTTNDYNNYRTLKISYEEIVDNYYRMFTSRKLKALILPNQKAITYDPFLTKFMVKAFDGNNTPRADLIKTFNVNEDPNMHLPTIWDALLERDTDILNYITTRVYLTPASFFTNEPVYEGIYYSGVNDVVYPANPIPDIDSAMSATPCMCKVKQAYGIAASNDLKSITSMNGTPLIKRANLEGYYIFSKDFYNKTLHMSLLEAQVWNYIENKPVDQDIIVALVKDYHNWGSLEKCYYLPVLLLLIQSVIRGI